MPTYRDDVSPLAARLAELEGVGRYALVIYDDGGGNDELVQRHADVIFAFPGPACLVSCAKNMGRSHARNRLAAFAQTDWLLFLDADMLPDESDFLSLYLHTIGDRCDPGLIAGGFSLKQIRPRWDQRLHFAQSEASECLAASARARQPGRYVFTSNILVHKTALQEVSFDERFVGWGWEDVDWGLRVAERFPIVHIDNPVTHLGLEEDAVLIDKFAASAHNFGRLLEKHPEVAEAMALTRAARRLGWVRSLQPVIKLIALARWLPIRARILALKTYRAMAYAEVV